MCALWVPRDPNFLLTESEYSITAVQAASLRWAHKSFCWFGIAPAYIRFMNFMGRSKVTLNSELYTNAINNGNQEKIVQRH